MIIPRISEALDAELLRQGNGLICLGSIDAEHLALAAIEEIANQLAKEGFTHPARRLRSQIGDGK